MSKALANPKLFAATGLLFALATFVNLTFPPSEATAGAAIVSPAHATPVQANTAAPSGAPGVQALAHTR